MARIRTVKPEFFRHEDLFDAEVETGLPLRIAFIGMWTVCDREGRFEWRPRSLKMDVLPYDKIDFSRVLDALTTRGFIERYTADGKEYGVIPGFKRHQLINGREVASKIPPPPEPPENTEETTRERRVGDVSLTRHGNARGEREGEREREREREGEESSRSVGASERENSTGHDPETDWTPDRLYDAVLAALGLTSGHIPTYWMPPVAPIHVWRWHADLKLPPEAIIDAVRQQRARYDTPPNGPKALDRTMQMLSAALNDPPLKPIAGATAPRPPQPSVAEIIAQLEAEGRA